MKTLEIIEKKWNPNFELEIGFVNNQLAYIGYPGDPLPKFFKNAEIVKKISNFTVEQESILKLLENFINKKEQPLCLNNFFALGTNFENQVWNELFSIPFGMTITYAELANKIGKPKATRAVASAVANNPFLLLVPCHRVVSKDGTLKYRSGASRKHFLLTNGY